MSIDCVQGAEHTQMIEAHSRDIARIEGNVAALFIAVDTIKDKLLGRPTWPVVFVLSSLSSLCVGLLVLLCKRSSCFTLTYERGLLWKNQFARSA